VQLPDARPGVGDFVLHAEVAGLGDARGDAAGNDERENLLTILVDPHMLFAQADVDHLARRAGLPLGSDVKRVLARHGLGRYAGLCSSRTEQQRGAHA